MELLQQVIKALRKIPKGKVTTYKELSKHLNTRGYRAVGTAVGKNPYAPKVPCHRVVRSDGAVGGYAFGPKKKIALLSKEGVVIKGGKVVNFSDRFYSFPKR